MPAPTLSELTLGIFDDDPFEGLAVELTPSAHPHARARIRDAAVGRLRAAALLPTRIRPMRALPTLIGDLPAVFVYTLNESDPEVYSEGPLIYTRKLDLVVHAVSTEPVLPDGITLEDCLDAIAYVVELLLVNDRGPDGALSNQASRCTPGSTSVQYEDEGDRLLIHAALTFRIEYQQEFAVPVEDALELVAVDWDLGPPDEQIEAQDEIELDQP